ncbi:MAG: SPRY domain-containing protein [Rhodocyclaceae bacterium]
MHPYLLPHLMGGCSKHRVKRSLLCAASASARATFTPAAPATSLRIGTISLWWKPAYLYTMSSAILVGGNQDYLRLDPVILGDTPSLQFLLNGGANGNVRSGLRICDPTAWRHTVVRWNTEQANPSDRIQIYDYGDLITSLEVASYPALNTNLAGLFQNGQPHAIGSRFDGLGFFDGCIAEVHLIDGQSLGPEHFGRKDPRSGNWAPIAWSGDHGRNGGYYPFIGDAGDAPATVAEGLKDRAPIGGAHVSANNYTPVNIATNDFVKDTPTNYRSGEDYRGNYCTLNPLDNGSVAAPSHGNLRQTLSGNTGTGAVSTFVPTRGRWYWEITVNSLTNAAANLGVIRGNLAATTFLSSNPSGVFYNSGGTKYVDGVNSAYGAAWGTLGVDYNIGIALNCDTQEITFSLNGISQGPIPLPNSTFGWKYHGQFSSASGQALTKVNFGQRPFAYAPPAGFKPLVTSAMPPPKVGRPSLAAVGAVNTGTNIESAIATLRIGWGAWYEEFKNITNAQSWKLRFSDDLANMLGYDTATGKVAFTAPTPADNYLGYATRVGSEWGVFTAEVAHNTGAATQVAHGLGAARKVAEARRTDADGDWLYLHPDLDAGKLLYKDAITIQTTDARLTVDATNVVLGAALPTGTYRVIVRAEIDGLRKFGRYNGNSSADGRNVNIGITPFRLDIKDLGGLSFWFCYDWLEKTGNPVDRVRSCNTNSAGNTSYPVARLAVGFKNMFAAGDPNQSGQQYVYEATAAAAFSTGDCVAQGTAR